MLGESRLNVYILSSHISSRQRERLQAQVQAALHSIPEWALSVLDRRIDQAGVRNFPLIVEALPAGSPERRSLSLGDLEGRPAAKLMPRLAGEEIVWGQELRYLVLKAVAYLAAPPADDRASWDAWSRAVEADSLRSRARESADAWRDSSDLDLFVEMFAGYALNETHTNWAELSAVRAFLDGWRS